MDFTSMRNLKRDLKMANFIIVGIVSLLLASTNGEECCDKSLADRIKKLEDNHHAEISNLRNALSEQSKVTNALAATVERQEDLIKNLLNSRKADITEGGTRNYNTASHQGGKRLVLSGDMVAFTAYVDHNIAHMGIDQVIPYNQVVTNIGSGFNTNTHTFHCPMSGLYLFNFFVSEIGVRELVAKLVVDGKNVIDAIANPISGSHDQQGGNSAVIQVNQGQSVWIANYFQNDVYLRTDENYRFASFSGILLQAM